MDPLLNILALSARGNNVTKYPMSVCVEIGTRLVFGYAKLDLSSEQLTRKTCPTLTTEHPRSYVWPFHNAVCLRYVYEVWSVQRQTPNQMHPPSMVTNSSQINVQTLNFFGVDKQEVLPNGEPHGWPRTGWNGVAEQCFCRFFSLLLWLGPRSCWVHHSRVRPVT